MGARNHGIIYSMAEVQLCDYCVKDWNRASWRDRQRMLSVRRSPHVCQACGDIPSVTITAPDTVQLGELRVGDVVVFSSAVADTWHVVRSVESQPRNMVSVELERMTRGQPDGYRHTVRGRASTGGFIVERSEQGHEPNSPLAKIRVTDAQMSIIQIYCDDPAHDEGREDWWPKQVSATQIEFPADAAASVASLLTDIANSESDDPGGDRGAWRAATALATKVRQAGSTVTQRENPRIRLEPGQHLESRHVLAGAYRGRGRAGSTSNLEDRALLTHSVIVGADERDVRTLCGFDKDRLGDTYGETQEDLASPPSCPRCLIVWERIWDQEAARLGIESGEVYREQVRLSQGILAEIAEEPDDDTHRQNPRRRAAGLREGDDDANRRRGVSGRFEKSTMCDFCGKSCAAGHFTDDRLSPGSDGPGFYLCGRTACVRQREQLEAREGFEALAARYIAQRKKNDAVKREPEYRRPLPESAQGGIRGDLKRAAMTREGALELAETYGHQMSAWEGNVSHCLKCGKTVRFDPVYGAGGDAWYRGSTCVQTPNGSYYVWVLGSRGEPVEGPYGPHDLEGGKTFARIGATEGAHDRAVSRGLDPESPSFEIVRRYRAGTGERVL